METQRRPHGVYRERQRLRERVSPEPERTLGPCQARIETQYPCPYPAAVRLHGVPLCDRHAREQEAYFAIGDLTQAREKKGVRERNHSGERLARGLWGRVLRTLGSTKEDG